MCSRTLLFLCTLLGVSVADILVQTPKGSIRGRALISPGNRTFYGFTSVPYAKPPIGTLRFQAPVEADPWDGVLDTITDPDPCFQVNRDLSNENENCLFLNIFTPALDLQMAYNFPLRVTAMSCSTPQLIGPNNFIKMPLINHSDDCYVTFSRFGVNSTNKLPVVLTIYGGSFRSGSAGYGRGGPDWFVERDIIVVSFNYRVGPMGFLSTGDTIIPGNAGLKDQQFALKWVYNNIELFGGNKDHITLHGQSAGAASVTYQLLNQKNKGLIVGAVAQSGSAICPWAWVKDNLAYTKRLANVVNNNTPLQNTSSAYLLEFLQSATARQVDSASATLYSSGIPLPTLEPEHEGAFITESMYELLASGNVVKVPLFIGINSEEEIGMAGNIPNLQTRAKRYDDNPLLLVPSQLGAISDGNRTIVANLIKEAYVGDDTFSNKLGSVVTHASDDEFTRAVIRFGELYSQYSPVYFYQFSYEGPMGLHNNSIEGAETVAHGEEYYYMGIVKVGHYDNTKYDRFPASDVLTHWRVIELWSNFYKYGNPTPEPVELLSNLTWPVVTPDNFVYLNINTTLELKDTPKSPRYNTWRYVYDTYGIRPFYIY